MRVQTEEWRRFIPGVRMYKGKKTLFYRERIVDEDGEPLIYDSEERQSWEVVIVLPGVEVIPDCTFMYCKQIETVIMADDVRRIEGRALFLCERLSYVRLSRNIEYIGFETFWCCLSLTSIFIPDSCREIATWAFAHCEKLIILHVPPQTEVLGFHFVLHTALAHKSNFPYHVSTNAVQMNKWINLSMNEWIKSINENNEYALHCICSSMDPSEDDIYQMICEQGGLHAMTSKNSVGITPSEYLAANPYADVDEMKLMKRFVLGKMGEMV